MFTIILILAGIKSGNIGLTLYMVIFIWTCILCSIHKGKKKQIDKYMDYYYGDINWIKNRKL